MDKIFESINLNNDSLFSEKKFLLDRYFVNFNGNLYNKNSLCKNIDLKECNTKIFIASLFEKYQSDMFQMLKGIYSISIYDKESKKLFLARDRVGLKSFYIYFKDNSLLFGNSLQDFYKDKSFEKKIDKNGLALYLSYGYVLQPYTIFENTHKIKSGHFIEFDIKSKSFFQHPYWKLESCYNDKKPIINEKDVLSKAEELLYKSISKRLEPTASLASSLSGGYDSSIVAALLSKQNEKKLNTFTIGFHQEKINEAKYAKEIASHLGTDHHEHYFSDEDAINIVPKLSDVYDEPFADYGATPTVLMSMLVKEAGFDTLFVGDGGDEVFATADDVAKFDKILNIPYSGKMALYTMMNAINPLKIPYIKSYQNLPTKYYKFLQILKSKTVADMVKAKPILFFDKEIELLLKKDDIDFKTVFDEIDFPSNAETVDQVIGCYFKTTMVDAELVKSFQATRYSNITIKEPLLDKELINFMAKVPSEIKIKDGIKKYILKEIAHKHIPKSLLDRPKSGFDIPFSLWLKGPLKELLYTHINEKRLEEDNLFDTTMILDIRDKFYNGNESYKYKLWTIFLFQLWYEKIKLK